MADKSKKKIEKKAPSAEEKTAPALAAPLTPAPLPRRGTGRPVKPRSALVSAQASATKTSPIVLAALKAAYGWTERTRLTRQEFLRKRDEWLARPASEV